MKLKIYKIYIYKIKCYLKSFHDIVIYNKNDKITRNVSIY